MWTRLKLLWTRGLIVWLYVCKCVFALWPPAAQRLSFQLRLLCFLSEHKRMKNDVDNRATKHTPFWKSLVRLVLHILRDGSYVKIIKCDPVHSAWLCLIWIFWHDTSSSNERTKRAFWFDFDWLMVIDEHCKSLPLLIALTHNLFAHNILHIWRLIFLRTVDRETWIYNRKINNLLMLRHFLNFIVITSLGCK